MRVYLECLRNGLTTENSVFIMVLGPRPTFVVTTSAVNVIGTGLSSLVVLMFSDLITSVPLGVIPGRVRPPAGIVAVAPLMTVVQLLIQNFVPSIYTTLDIYIPLTVMDCTILGRVEAYAFGTKPTPVLFDGLDMGLGFTLAFLLLGFFHEIIGAGLIFGIKLIPDTYYISTFALPPGAFSVIVFLAVGMQYYQDDKRGKKSRPVSFERAKTKIVRPVAKPAAAAAAAQVTVATIAVEAKNPVTKKKEETR